MVAVGFRVTEAELTSKVPKQFLQDVNLKGSLAPWLQVIHFNHNKLPARSVMSPGMLEAIQKHPFTRKPATYGSIRRGLNVLKPVENAGLGCKTMEAQHESTVLRGLSESWSWPCIVPPNRIPVISPPQNAENPHILRLAKAIDVKAGSSR